MAKHAQDEQLRIIAELDECRRWVEKLTDAAWELAREPGDDTAQEHRALYELAASVSRAFGPVEAVAAAALDAPPDSDETPC